MVYSTDATLPLEEIYFKDRINNFIINFLPKADTENGDNEVKYYKQDTIRIDPAEKHITGLIYSTNIPEKWRKDGISAPTLTCKKIAESTSHSIYKDYALIPNRISATIEEGIFINYINFDTNSILSIEIYNDSDIAAILTDGKKIIKVVDIINESFTDIIKLFKEI